MKKAIEVNKIYKRYTINNSKTSERLFQKNKKSDLSKLQNLITRKKEEFWALKDVSFDIEKGDIVGIIGSNGAGKSTLLKILSKITAPTKGDVKFYGRMASLLEVGTGFHDELSGRDNIFLNGSILGMSKDEISKKIDDIINFSGIEKFIDTPVKYYSSGMSVRLAFSVAAFLDPEILLLDEVLSVGDISFQKRSLQKIKEISEKSGKTILYVSHNMSSIKNLCNKCLFIKDGELDFFGDTEIAIKKYLQTDVNVTAQKFEDVQEIIKSLPNDKVFKLKGIDVFQEGEPVFDNIVNGYPIEIKIKYDVKEETTGLRVFIDVLDNEDNIIFRSFHDEIGTEIPTMKIGSYTSTVEIPSDIFCPTRYKLSVNATIFNKRNFFPSNGICFPFDIIMSSVINRAYVNDSFQGKLSLPLNWRTIKD